MRIKRMILLLAAIFMAVMPGCAAQTEDAPQLDMNTGVFELAPLFADFTQAYASNSFDYTLNGKSLHLAVYERSTPVTDLYPDGLDGFEKRTGDGSEYYYRTDSVCWDGVDETGEWIGGLTTSAYVLQDTGDYLLVLSGSSEDEDVSHVTHRLLTDLLEQNEVEGLEQTNRYVGARFSAAPLECNISLVSRQSAAGQELLAQEDTEVRQQNGIRYLAKIRERTPDEPHTNFIICDTDQGVLVVSCGVAYGARNDVPAERLDFVNFSLAKKIADRLDVEICSIHS